MMEFKPAAGNRKVLAARIAELTGEQSKYMGMPSAAYRIGSYMVAKDGTLTIDEGDADRHVIRTLLDEGLVSGELPEEDDGQPMEPEESTEAMDETGETETDTLNISFPANKHTGTSLRNLVHLLYSRGPMINKAVGAHFHVEKGLIDALSDDACIRTPETFRRAVADYEDKKGTAMSGIQMTPDTVTLCGFGADGGADHAKACMELAALMNRMAITQKRIQAKEIDVENEKYAFRVWLLRLGMNGDDYKQTRKILLGNLSGHSAFRTEADAEKFKERAKQKRDELKAAKEAARNAGEPQGTEAAQDTEGGENNG